MPSLNDLAYEVRAALDLQLEEMRERPRGVFKGAATTAANSVTDFGQMGMRANMHAMRTGDQLSKGEMEDRVITQRVSVRRVPSGFDRPGAEDDFQYD